MSHASLSSGYHNSAVLLRGLSATRKQPRKTGNQSSGPSMRRPIRVKSIFTLSKGFFFFRSAKPPLSPPFHPHS
jgi:hypothetical protein